MRMNGHSRLISMVFGVLSACGIPAHAISLHFWPTNISVQARPGQVVSQTFNLTLSKECPASRFQARVEDWWRSPDNNQTFYAPAGTLSRSCGHWCSINPVESSVNPGQTMTIKVSIRVPDNVQPGGYWAALTVDQVPDPLAPKLKGVGMTLKGSVSVGIFVEIPEIKRSARITGVSVTGNRVSVTLCNDGNTPLKVNPSFEFYKPGQDKPIAAVKIGAQPLLTDQHNKSEFSTLLPDEKDLPSGQYKVRVIVDAGLDFLLGAENEVSITRAPSSG